MVAHTASRAHRGISAALATTLVVVLGVGLLAAAFFCAWVFNQRMERLYRDHVYPGVTVMDVELGAMDREEARATLAHLRDYPRTEELLLRHGEVLWSVPWEEAGLSLNVEATVGAAFAAGREAPTLYEELAAWFAPHDVPPVFEVDLNQTRAVLEELSQEVSQPPVEPGVALENGEVVIVPGEAGRVLDVTTMLGHIQALPASGEGAVVDLVFREVQPAEPDVTEVRAQAEALLARQIHVFTYDVLTDETFTWTLGRDDIAPWLVLTREEGGAPLVDVDPDAVEVTLAQLAGGMGAGRGFRLEDATRQVLDAFAAGGGAVALYMTHPQRTYVVQPGDTLTSLSATFGMPPGLVAEANPDIDYDNLYVGQEVIIPSQDLLTPYLPVPGKRIVINLDEQRMRVYEEGVLIHDWLVSTGLEDSPTHRGVFQIVSKEEEAYASQWDLLMPYFMAIYPAGGTVYNGIHELPFLENGSRLWEGHLGRPASFGCVILGIPEAETLFDWAELGTLVIVE
jgi:lipoprotein-anchoring transpeptidase ErfK/SrfK